jgi:hypothetical protein
MLPRQFCAKRSSLYTLVMFGKTGRLFLPVLDVAFSEDLRTLVTAEFKLNGQQCLGMRAAIMRAFPCCGMHCPPAPFQFASGRPGPNSHPKRGRELWLICFAGLHGRQTTLRSAQFTSTS